MSLVRLALYFYCCCLVNDNKMSLLPVRQTDMNGSELSERRRRRGNNRVARLHFLSLSLGM
jgi:hypothetical protein